MWTKIFICFVHIVYIPSFCFAFIIRLDSMETKYGIYEMLTYGEGMKGLIYSTNYLDKVNQAFSVCGCCFVFLSS